MKQKSTNTLVVIGSCAALTCLVGVLATAAGLFDWPIWQSAVLFAAVGLIAGGIAAVRRKSVSGSGEDAR
ncbi:MULTISPECIES: hypothetical protein [Streptomyces]|uniref:hypothetical protein n=1 Tax=Streptomyces TaxID=1883 RepID=UPI001319D946|nr:MULTISPECIES: hypothetical protein [Streptomyces]MBZ6114220.1 hypothetical protein [Streptomyces olivaceus]MBZ6128325.1 hypothetical protein [Streptomyces olivaceus]MBZ6135492.1 hypothetical protein [Streptomyces olivaceus]MBZ6148832.1 hypothetical protein [Streptomyces olivaceus]MBZ6163089.1 hypothetical protein [Streptomyces olivaceus]